MKWNDIKILVQNNPGVESHTGSKQGIDAGRLTLIPSFMTLNGAYRVGLDIIFSTFVDD